MRLFTHTTRLDRSWNERLSKRSWARSLVKRTGTSVVCYRCCRCFAVLKLKSPSHGNLRDLHVADNGADRPGLRSSTFTRLAKVASDGPPSSTGEYPANRLLMCLFPFCKPKQQLEHELTCEASKCQRDSSWTRQRLVNRKAMWPDMYGDCREQNEGQKCGAAAVCRHWFGTLKCWCRYHAILRYCQKYGCPFAMLRT